MTQKEFISKIIDLMVSDPKSTASDYSYMLDNLPDYLNELSDQDGSITSGLLAAIETYLNK